MVRRAWPLLLLLACSPARPAGSTAAGGRPSASGWHASSPSDASPRSVRIDPGATWKAAATAILGDACRDAVLVWGDLVVDDALKPQAITIAVGDGAPVLSGFLVCESRMEPFLRMQTANPRLKAGHGGTADLKWRDGQLYMRRRWSAADIALGTLAPPPSGVFQHGEMLAAIVSVEDPKARPADVLAAVSRAPRVFLFAMFPLR
jgi:hypothetical protein